MSNDAGESLVELLVAILIMGITVVIVVGGLATSVMVSGTSRQQGQAVAHLKSFTANVDGIATAGYQNCATSTTYAPTYSPGGGFSAEIVDVFYWTGSGWADACTTDTGVQRITLRVWHTGYNVEERTDLIIRRP
jgi:hypothetical protein